MAEAELENLDTETQAQPTSPAEPDELAALLAQYDAEAGQPEADNGHIEPSQDEHPANGNAVEEITAEDVLEGFRLRSERIALNSQKEAFEQEVSGYINMRTQEAHEADLQKTVAEVRGDLDPALFSDPLVTAWIDAQARDRGQLQQLWLNRMNNPNALRIAVKQLTKDFAKEMHTASIDEGATEDRNAVVHAMRGASSRIPEEGPVKYGQLTNDDYRKEIRSTYGFDPNV
jgi:hypothetical protein